MVSFGLPWSPLISLGLPWSPLVPSPGTLSELRPQQIWLLESSLGQYVKLSECRKATKAFPRMMWARNGRSQNPTRQNLLGKSHSSNMIIVCACLGCLARVAQCWCFNVLHCPPKGKNKIRHLNTSPHHDGPFWASLSGYESGRAAEQTGAPVVNRSCPRSAFSQHSCCPPVTPPVGVFNS